MPRSSPQFEPLALRLRVPYPVGHVNAYLLPGDPLTLVDAGMRWPRGLAELDAALATHGVRTAEIELLAITHHHDDHAGLAAAVQQISGCEVAAHAETAARLADVESWRQQEDAYETAMLRLHGADEQAVRTVTEPPSVPGGVASVTVDRVLRDGDVLRAGGQDLAVALQPGHSPSDTLLVSAHGWALLGDHLFAETVTPIIAHLPLAGDDPADRPPALLTYRQSLARTADLGLAVGLPGHGPVIADVASVVSERLAEHDRRAARILERMPDSPVSAWTLVREMRLGVGLDAARELARPRHSMTPPFISLSTMLAILDLLADRGLVEQLRDDGAVLYARRH